jgi:hypothetical protein
MLTSEHLLAAYSSALAPRSALYISTPITSGERFLTWAAKYLGSAVSVDEAIRLHREEHTREVVEPNVLHAAKVAEHARARSQFPVINPARVPHINGWRQADWIAFWEKVIQECCLAVMALDGWELSFGCAHEVVFALEHGIPVYSERHEQLSLEAIKNQLSAALQKLGAVNADTSKHCGLVAILDEISCGARSIAPVVERELVL